MLAPLESDPRLPAIRAHHSFHEGGRVNFRSRKEIELGLQDGYLELEVVDDQGLVHCLVRYVTLADGYGHEGYLYTEAPKGMTHEWAAIRYLNTGPYYDQQVYETLGALCEVYDLHAFKWYPLTSVSTFPFPFYRQSTHTQVLREEVPV